MTLKNLVLYFLAPIKYFSLTNYEYSWMFILV